MCNLSSKTREVRYEYFLGPHPSAKRGRNTRGVTACGCVRSSLHRFRSVAWRRRRTCERTWLWHVRSSCGASGCYLRRVGAATSRWPCAANVQTQGHVARIQGPDAISGTSGHPNQCVWSVRRVPHLDPNGSISWGCLYKWFGWLGLTLLAIFIDIAT
jgi:hypothetical protein